MGAQISNGMLQCTECCGEIEEEKFNQIIITGDMAGRMSYSGRGLDLS